MYGSTYLDSSFDMKVSAFQSLTVLSSEAEARTLI